MKTMTFQRMDHISNMKISDKPATPITDIPGYENGIDFKKLATSMPYMYADNPEHIEFIADKSIVDQIVDWFGKEVRMSELPDNKKKIKAEVVASPMAMEHWALQYLNHVEVTKPESLRSKICESLKNGNNKYN
jgi:predicted DNA-binding transcriptional regulator YafY